jgi:hypothetical protein
VQAPLPPTMTLVVAPPAVVPAPAAAVPQPVAQPVAPRMAAPDAAATPYVAPVRPRKAFRN